MIINETMRPLELLVERYDFGADHTGGRFYIDGMPFGDSMEPPSRHLSNSMPLSEIKAKKVYGKTAIPTGRYELELRVSPSLKNRAYARKYDGKFPYLKNIPGWTNVMFHPFNYGSESKGCIAVGEKWKPGAILKATKGYEDMMDYYLVPAFERGQRVFVTINEV